MQFIYGILGANMSLARIHLAFMYINKLNNTDEQRFFFFFQNLSFSSRIFFFILHVWPFACYNVNYYKIYA